MTKPPSRYLCVTKQDARDHGEWNIATEPFGQANAPAHGMLDETSGNFAEDRHFRPELDQIKRLSTLLTPVETTSKPVEAPEPLQPTVVAAKEPEPQPVYPTEGKLSA